MHRMSLRRFVASLLLCGVLTVPLSAGKAHAAPVDYVKPLIGTESTYDVSHGNCYPAAAMPFGMVQWTPQTSDGNEIYQYTKDKISGFRGTHQPSLWMGDYGAFSLMPVVGAVGEFGPPRASHFSHQRELAQACQYKVHLDDYDTDVTLVPSERGALMQFDFHKNGQPSYVFLDARGGGSTAVIHAERREIEGSNAEGWTPNYPCYFVLRFDTPFAAVGTLDSNGIYYQSKHREGEHVGAFVRFDAPTVKVRIGTSFISLEQARRNLDRELPDFDLAAAYGRARSAWDHGLSRIDVSGGTPAQLVTFYTALYRCLLFPRMLYEVGSAGPVYRSPYDKQVHHGYMYADSGFWDTYRTEFPLLCMLYPQRVSEICQSMLAAYKEGGWLPKWPHPNETNVMIGTHGDSILADAWCKGVRGFDVSEAYRAAAKDGTEQGDANSSAREGIEYYEGIGYLPADLMREATSRTLEFAYDDFCVAQLARAAGLPGEYEKFSRRARNYRTVFDPQSGFMRGRKLDGGWLTPFDPLAWGSPYTEGCAWQYTFSVQQDVPGLVALFGGRDKFIGKLDALFNTAPEFHLGNYHQVVHEMRELAMVNMGQYAHNNEPVHHDIYLYDWVGQPYKTQALARTATSRLYTDQPDGIIGDEDTGQMSAWYVMSALGFYPFCPGQPVYVMGSPLFARAVLHLPNGRDFEISAPDNAPDRPYIQAATLDGKPLTQPWFTHDTLTQGGKLELHLGTQPNVTWGARPQDAPPPPLPASPLTPCRLQPLIHCHSFQLFFRTGGYSSLLARGQNK
jgi:predicted alpha-1,2-mannosidase